MSKRILPALLALGLAHAAIPARARAAGPDGNVEWAGVSHVAWQDRRPLCPVDGQAFEVLFQTWRNDLTSASVHVVAGASVSDLPAARIGTRGPYDVWRATLPATAAASESYWIALTDGALTDYLSVSGMSHTLPVDGGFGLDFGTLAHAPVGATLVPGGVVFRVWSPTTVSCYVRGSFGNWGPGTPLGRVGEYWIGRVPGAAEGDEYKYYFNNSVWNTDPRARGLDASNSNYNAIVGNPFRFAWTDSAWSTPSFDSLVVYQLHVGTFSGRNDPVGATAFPSGYRDLAARVGHLRDLGVNAVMLNPVTEFPGGLSAGYNPITQWSPEWNYGAPDDFKFMVNALHRAGIAVILDIVWNHFSPTDNFLWYYDGTQQWFETPDVGTPWGSQAAFGRAAVADYFANSATSWLGEYHLDGFRMDATSAMTTGIHSASGWSLMQRMNGERLNRFAGRIAIAEQFPLNASTTTPSSSGGAGFDAQYDGPFRDAVRQAIFDAAFGDPNMDAVRAALVGFGPQASGAHVLNYVELHDEAWPASGGQRLVKDIDATAPYDDEYAKGRTKLAEGLVLSSQGVPAMLMGDEWLEDTDFSPDASHRIDWSKQTTYAGIYRYYQTLIRWRRTLPSLGASSAIHVFHVDETNNVIGFRRFDASGNAVVVIANFGNSDRVNERIGVPDPAPWEEIVNSQDPLFEGAGPVNVGSLPTQPIVWDGFNQSLVLQVPRMGLLVLAPVSIVGVGNAPASLALALEAPSPNPSARTAALRFTLPSRTTASLAIYDVAGRRVRAFPLRELEAGGHAQAWDGRDDEGRPLREGLYFVRLETPLGARTVRLTRLD